LDSFSTDRTKEICQKLNVRFYEQAFLGYAQQKRKALEFALFPHVLSLDADEVVSPELFQSIITIKANPSADGYYMNRLTNYCGHWIKHTDWYPDRKLRLWDTRKGNWKGINVHERVEMNSGSTIEVLKGDLLHYSFPSISHHLKVIEKYSAIMATEAIQTGKRSGWLFLIFSPIFKFLKSFIFRLGFLDGYYGFLVCFFSAYATFVKYAKIKRFKNATTPGHQIIVNDEAPENHNKQHKEPFKASLV
jgi:glycosyltransferase involved in cell wall biosynthesis